MGRWEEPSPISSGNNSPLKRLPRKGQRRRSPRAEGWPPWKASGRRSATAGAVCSISTRHRLVFGEGSPQAELVFVGEAPGADEDAQGRPFVGRAGQLLTKIIGAMGLRTGGGLHMQHPEVPPSREPQSPAGRDRRLRALSDPAAQGDPAEGHLRPGDLCGPYPAEIGGADQRPAGAVPLLPGDSADADLPPGLSAQKSRGEETGLGGCPDGHAGPPGGKTMIRVPGWQRGKE